MPSQGPVFKASSHQMFVPHMLLHDTRPPALCSLSVLAIAGKQVIRNAAVSLWEHSCTSSSNMQHGCACCTAS